MTDVGLEPSGYRVFLSNRAVASGQIDRRYLYLQADAASGLGLSGTPPDADIKAAIPSLVAVRSTALRKRGRLGELLAITPEELVVRRVGALIKEHAKELGGP